MEIKNEVRVDKTGPNAKEEKKFVNRSMAEVQRAKLDKLMKNPDKPVLIPVKRKEKDYEQNVPSFVRNVMGSSAGAGSGEFHVYRHLRRKEYARQKYIQIKSEQELLDDEFEKKLEGNKSKAEEKTAKKRAKRQKRKQKSKQPKIDKTNIEEEVSEDDGSESEDLKEVENDSPAVEIAVEEPIINISEQELSNPDKTEEFGPEAKSKNNDDV